MNDLLLFCEGMSDDEVIAAIRTRVELVAEAKLPGGATQAWVEIWKTYRIALRHQPAGTTAEKLASVKMIGNVMPLAAIVGLWSIGMGWEA